MLVQTLGCRARAKDLSHSSSCVTLAFPDSASTINSTTQYAKIGSNPWLVPTLGVPGPEKDLLQSSAPLWLVVPRPDTIRFDSTSHLSTMVPPLGTSGPENDLLQSFTSSVTCHSPARHHQLQRHHATCHYWCQHLGCRVRVKDLLQSSTPLQLVVRSTLHHQLRQHQSVCQQFRVV